MAKSAAERAAAYRARRLQAGIHEVDKEKQVTRMKRFRSTLESTNKKAWKARVKRVTDRRRAARQSKRLEGPATGHSGSATGYKCPQSLGKAFRRANRSLPQCSVKRAAVLRKLANDNGLLVVYPPTTTTSPQFPPTPSEEERHNTEVEVGNFYRRDDISWQSPCAKHRVIIREKDSRGRTVSKTYTQKRFLIMSIREAHQLYLHDHAEMPVNLSKFRELRPVEVDLMSHIPHNVCVCKYHANMAFLLEALNPHVGIPTLDQSSDDFLKAVTCDPQNKSCMSLKCHQCKVFVQGFNPKYSFVSPTSVMVRCKQWRVDSSGRLSVEEMTWNAQECFDELLKQLGPFLLHVFLKRSQEKAFSDCKQAVDGKTVVLQVDYAENYALKFQNEIQSAHWNQSHCSIFTAHAWVNIGKGESYALVSNDLTHDKYSVFKNLDVIPEHLNSTYDDIKEVHMFSDGAASQFKQRFLFANLDVLEQMHGIRIEWHYFATSHGKGVVDAHGGTVKGAVWRRTSAGASVKTAKDFADVAAEACPAMNTQYVSQESIRQNTVSLDEHWANIKAVPGTQRIHWVRSLGPYVVQVARTSHAPEEERLVARLHD